jgi:hypothetical protein
MTQGLCGSQKEKKPLLNREVDQQLAGVQLSHKQKNYQLRGFNLQANYTDRVTAACRQS